MKKLILVLVAVLMLASVITACGCPKEEGGAPTITSAQGQKTTSTSIKTTKESSGGDAGWDIPIYPGADQVIKMKTDEDTSDGPRTLEHRMYTTGDSPSDVADFYQDKMPANGWEQEYWTEIMAGSGYMGQFKKGDKDTAVIGIADDSKGGTVINLDRSHYK